MIYLNISKFILIDKNKICGLKELKIMYLKLIEI